MATITERLAKHGFTLVQLGGGCDGWERTDGEITERILDDVGGFCEPTAPQAESDPIFVVYGEDLDSDNDDVASINGYTLGDALAALEHPSDEYYLLALRLDNFTKRVPE